MALQKAQSSLQQGQASQEEARTLVEESRDILALSLDAKVRPSSLPVTIEDELILPHNSGRSHSDRSLDFPYPLFLLGTAILR